MNERRDDTTKPEPESRPAPGAYYYDDATGYELFDPADEEEEEEEEDARGGAESAPGRSLDAAGPVSAASAGG